MTTTKTIAGAESGLPDREKSALRERQVEPTGTLSAGELAAVEASSMDPGLGCLNAELTMDQYLAS